MQVHGRPIVGDRYGYGWILTIVIGVCAQLVGGSAASADESPEIGASQAVELEFFESKVRPLLVEHCYACHSGGSKKLQAGLRLDSRDALLSGGDSGAALIPGNAEDSLLVQAVRYEAYEMPPRGKLSEQDIQTLARWVDHGAVWPTEQAPQAADARPEFDLQQRAQEHWAWQPFTAPELPQVKDAAWPYSDLDYFVLARLEAAGLQPAPDVERLVLLRRLCFDLLGLPPTIEQISGFMADQRPDAVPRLVDDLLQSPHFGERWGRHWLDLVRYAESRGHEFDDDSENAFQYRDYVIRALNADVPYDQFVREHVAGDLLRNPRLNPAEGFNESILGTGFWFLGEWVHSPVDIRKDETDRFDNMIDVMSKTFLGLTVACARCHDHKFDAISTADYYSLCGFLQSSDFRQVRFDAVEQNRALAGKLAELDAHYRSELESLWGENRERVTDRKPQAGGDREPPQAAAFTSSPIEAPLPTALNPSPLERMRQSTAGLNAEDLPVDYANLPASDYLQDGFIFGLRPSRAGELILAGSPAHPQLATVLRTAAVSDAFWDGIKSINEPGVKSRSALAKIPRSGRTLRTPTFTLEHGEVACRVQGSGHVVACVDSHRLVAGPLHAETVVKIQPQQPWVKLHLTRYVGHRLHLEFTPNVDSQLSVSCVVQGPTADKLQAVEQREADEQQWAAERQATIQRLLASDAELAGRVQAVLTDWSAERQSLKAQVKTDSRLAMAMLDGTGEDDHILIRGSSANPGKVEPRHFLTALAGQASLAISVGSGRLELAEQINAPNNPLTARVIVNRLWHHLLGRGIVPTTDDFGVLGQPPTDLLLLDHLATEFIRDGRSIKRAIRAIVLSHTYQQSGQLDSRAVQLDPQNALWHYRPPKRLEGEVIRDALLAISGQLDRTQFGPPIAIHLTPFMDGRGRPESSGPLDGAARRSIYVAVRRNFLSPFMMAFDTPTPFSTMGRRTSSNVPAQALILMNDPFVVAQCQHWAERGLQTCANEASSGDPAALLDWFYMSGLGRPPNAEERQAAAEFITQQTAQQGTIAAAWHDLAHALVNTKEFIFLR